MAKLRPRKIVRQVKAATYGVSLGVVPRGNTYAGKPYGKHRKTIADQVRQLRKKARSHGYKVKGADSLHWRHQRDHQGN